jgi:hypothetical protein
VEDLLDHFGGIDGDLLKWVCWYGDGGLVKNLAGAEIFFLPKGGRLSRGWASPRAEQGSRSPAQWISYQPQTDSEKQEKAGERKRQGQVELGKPAVPRPLLRLRGREKCVGSGEEGGVEGDGGAARC